jgi:hypothetical protein
MRDFLSEMSSEFRHSSYPSRIAQALRPMSASGFKSTFATFGAAFSPFIAGLDEARDAQDGGIARSKNRAGWPATGGLPGARKLYRFPPT